DTTKLFARQFYVDNSCIIDNFSIYRSALANDTLQLTNGSTVNVDYGPLNVSLIIWNATWSGFWYEPDKAIKKTTLIDNYYGWAMNGSPQHNEYPEIGWETFNMSNFYLNADNTQNNYFFVSINTTDSNSTYDGKPIRSHYRWYLQNYSIYPNYVTFNSTDGGNNWDIPFILPFYSMTLRVNLRLPNTFYPSNISLRIDNIAVNDTTTTNQGLWNRLFFYPYDGDNYEYYPVQVNWPFISFDVSFNCTMNKSGSISSYYLANGTKDYIEWNSTLNFDRPNNNLNNTIQITFPASWNVISIKPSQNSINYTQGSQKILEIYNGTVGNIIINYTSSNYINRISIEQYKGGTVYLDSVFTQNIDETIRINATFAENVTSEAANLTVFDFNNIINYTGQQSAVNDIVTFPNWDIETTTKSNGSYLTRVFWANGTEVGINTTTLHIIYPTSSSLLSPSITQSFYGLPIDVLVYFENDFSDNIYGETSIQGANVTAIFNETSNVYNLTETLGSGYYNATIDTTGFENGTYDLNITIEKFGYQNRSYNLQIEILYNTSIFVNTTSLTIYYSEAFNLELNYNRSDIYINNGVNTSTIQVIINGTDETSNITIDNTEENVGNYTLRFNTTNCSKLLPDFAIIIVKISRQGFYERQVQINVTILKAITTLENYTVVTRRGGLETFNVTIFYNNTILNKGISGANLSIYKDNLPVVEVFSPTELNNDTFYLYDFQNGTYNIELNITIGKNYTMEILFVSNKTGYDNGNKTVYQGIWVRGTNVPIFLFSDIVTYGQNQTITLQYNVTGGIGISSANVFSTWDEIGFYNEFITNFTKGVYNITFNTNLTMAGNHSIIVNARKNGYEWNSTSITFRIAGYITNSTTLNSSTLLIYVNDSIFNIRVRYYNVSDNFNVSDGNVLFQLRDASNYLFDTEVECNQISYQNETNGEYNFTINTTSLHANIYSLNITIEFHNISIAFEYSDISFIINITRLPSNLTTILHVGNWWRAQNSSLKWFEWENITIYLNFKADFYDTGVPIEGNVSWGNLYYEIIKVGELTPVLQGQFLNLGGGIYEATINLSMPIQSKTSENYKINITGVALDIQNVTTEIDLKVVAKKEIFILFLPLQEEIVENDIILIKILVLDTVGRPAHGETLIININILTPSGYHIFRIPVKTVGGIAAIYFQVPYNINGIFIEANTERSMASWSSKSHYQPVPTLPPIYNAVKFLRIAWPFITAIAITAISLYYYKRKYKPKKIKRKEVRDTISYRFKSAANLVHVLVYDQKTSELLYVYSTPGIKLTTYLINSILESISMYDNMTVTRQEIYLRDDARLILHDGEYVRVAMITKELPSVEMQKQLEHFLNEFELKFGKKIPEWRQDISRLARMMDMGFANEIIELAFEKSLTFPHNIAPTEEEVKLTDLESKLFELAKNIRSKSGPFLLQRLIARGHTELSPAPLLKIMEGVYNLRKKKALMPLSAKEARRLKDETFKKGIGEKETNDSLST
ncbi:MAG: hypothetical protein HWN67_21855, partial [Candidatus Helarchaeota archaeon]|nr:hypothetical protein [Candidatus Helarchaeota archaeon]